MFAYGVNPLDPVNFVILNTVCFSFVIGSISLLIKSKFNNTEYFTRENMRKLLTIIIYSVIIKYSYNYMLSEYDLSKLGEYLVEIIPVLAITTQLFSDPGNNPSSLDTLSANNTQQGSVHASQDNTVTSHNPNTPVVPTQYQYENSRIGYDDKMPVPPGKHTVTRIKQLSTDIIPHFSTRDHNGAIDSLKAKIQCTRTDLSVVYANLNSVEHAMLRCIVKESPNTNGFSNAAGSIHFHRIKCDMEILQLADSFKK